MIRHPKDRYGFPGIENQMGVGCPVITETETVADLEGVGFPGIGGGEGAGFLADADRF